MKLCTTHHRVGSPAGPMTNGVLADVTLAYDSCVPASPSGLVNFTADLPGPGCGGAAGNVHSELTSSLRPRHDPGARVAPGSPRSRSTTGPSPRVDTPEERLL